MNPYGEERESQDLQTLDYRHPNYDKVVNYDKVGFAKTAVKNCRVKLKIIESR